MKNLFLKSLVVFITIFSVSALAQKSYQFLDLRDHQKQVTSENILARIHPGQVLVFSETHNTPDEHANQAKLLETLSAQAFVKNQRLSVAMEFFEYPRQNFVNEYMAGLISESQFLKSINWGSFDFGLYKKQVTIPTQTNGVTYAINLPMSIAVQIAMVGVDGLDPKLRAYLPQDFGLGRDSYRRRVYNYIPIAHPEIAQEGYANFFASMSAWDDTMAWQISNAFKNNPNQIIAVIVGNFHGDFGGGLQDRLRARGVSDILTIRQLDYIDNPQASLQNTLTSDPTDGPIADILWVTTPTKRTK